MNSLIGLNFGLGARRAWVAQADGAGARTSGRPVPLVQELFGWPVRFILILLLCALGGCAGTGPRLLTASDVLAFDNPPPYSHISYGPHGEQYGQLHVPTGPGPHPVAIFLHGGCWRAAVDLEYTGRFTAALTASGIATWSLEYRRVGNGGGWPATFVDVARGVDHLRRLAEPYGLDLDRVILMGHSAGGQLALWAAARVALAENSPLYVPGPLPVRGVIGLVPAPDLTALHEQRVCGHVVDELMGGSPRRRSDRYRDVDLRRIAPSVPQVLIIGGRDTGWAKVVRAYFARAARRGDTARLVLEEGAGHYELIDPASASWPRVLRHARRLLGEPRVFE